VKGIIPGVGEGAMVPALVPHTWRQYEGDACYMANEDVLPRMLFALDALDWTAVRATLADEVHVDYTSVLGGEPQILSAADLIAGWQRRMPGYDATMHLTGPVLAAGRTGPASRVETHAIAYHYIQGDHGGTWVVYGHYYAQIVDQKITELTLRAFYQEGSSDLDETARQRVADGRGR
jgi:hypothetical protein